MRKIRLATKGGPWNGRRVLWLGASGLGENGRQRVRDRPENGFSGFTSAGRNLAIADEIARQGERVLWAKPGEHHQGDGWTQYRRSFIRTICRSSSDQGRFASGADFRRLISLMPAYRIIFDKAAFPPPCEDNRECGLGIICEPPPLTDGSIANADNKRTVENSQRGIANRAKIIEDPLIIGTGSRR